MKCIECNSSNILFTELWKDHYIQFKIEDGVMKQQSMGEGDPYKVESECLDCGTRHVLDNCFNINDIK